MDMPRHEHPPETFKTQILVDIDLHFRFYSMYGGLLSEKLNEALYTWKGMIWLLDVFLKQ